MTTQLLSAVLMILGVLLVLEAVRMVGGVVTRTQKNEMTHEVTPISPGNRYRAASRSSSPIPSICGCSSLGIAKKAAHAILLILVLVASGTSQSWAVITTFKVAVDDINDLDPNIKLFLTRTGSNEVEEHSGSVDLIGNIVFTIPQNETVDGVVVGRNVGEDSESYEILEVSDGTTVGSLEPFNYPSFFSSNLNTILIARIDLNEFLASSNPFVVGQVIGVTDGLITETPTITFMNAFGLLTDPGAQIFDTAFLASLPNYTGSVTVRSLDTVTVPEPGSALLMGLGVLVLVGCRRPRAVDRGRRGGCTAGNCRMR